jgi:hypothetical protein
MSPPGRPKGEYRSPQHEGIPVTEVTIKPRRWHAHAALWLAVALFAPLGLWAYQGAALELDVGMLLSLCAPAARN